MDSSLDYCFCIALIASIRGHIRWYDDSHFFSFLVIAFLQILWQFQAGQSLLNGSEIENQRIRSIGVQLQDVELNGLEARKVEKDFLMNGDSEVVEYHKSILKQMRCNIQAINRFNFKLTRYWD